MRRKKNVSATSLQSHIPHQSDVMKTALLIIYLFNHLLTESYGFDLRGWLSGCLAVWLAAVWLPDRLIG